MTLQDAIGIYLTHLLESGKRQGTLSAYRGDLHQFAEAVAGEGVTEIEAVTPELVAAFMESLDVAPATANRKAAVLTSFFLHLEAAGYLSAAPAMRIERQRATMPHARPVPSEVIIRQVVERAEHGTRDRAALELMALGLSPQEVADLTIAAYDDASGLVSVTTHRTGAVRCVMLSVSAICALGAYLATLPPRAKYPESPIIPNQFGRHCTRQGIWKIAMHNCPAHLRVSPRDLKRARVVALLAQGVDRETVAAQMGHSELSTTQQYERHARIRGAA